MRTIAVIPARYDSQRFRGKVLADISGKPLIRWVYERVSRASRVDAVYVATDAEEVVDACRGFTDTVFFSTEAHQCGTDRVAELARSLDADLFINVQTDEPLMDPALVDALVGLFADPGIDYASAVAPLHTVKDFLDPNVVKVVCDEHGDALYFTRAPIPWNRDEPPHPGRPLPEDLGALKHIGIYLYRRDALLKFAALPRAPLERIESLEQLRVLQQGWKMRILTWDYKGIGVDTREDLEQLRAHVAQASHPVRNG